MSWLSWPWLGALGSPVLVVSAVLAARAVALRRRPEPDTSCDCEECGGKPGYARTLFYLTSRGPGPTFMSKPLL